MIFLEFVFIDLVSLPEKKHTISQVNIEGRAAFRHQYV